MKNINLKKCISESKRIFEDDLSKIDLKDENLISYSIFLDCANFIDLLNDGAKITSSKKFWGSYLYEANYNEHQIHTNSKNPISEI